jgi:hypothetical protein
MKALEKIRIFGIKYYCFNFLQRLFISVGLSILIFFLFDLFEYHFWFNSQIRTFIFYFWLIFEFILLVSYVLIPLYKLFKLIVQPTYFELALIIAKKAPEIKEPLFNLIYVHEGKFSSGSEYLLLQSIEEQTNKISLINFDDVLPFKRTMLTFFGSTLLFLFFFLLTFLYPDRYYKPLERIFNFNTFYPKPLPYKLKILNSSLSTPSFADFTLNFSILGEKLPENVYVSYDNSMVSPTLNQTVYSVSIPVHDHDVHLRILMDDYVSDEYTIKVLARPTILKFQTELLYPSYVGKLKEVLINQNEINVPRGTNVVITFFTRNSDKFSYIYLNKSFESPIHNSVAEVKLFLLESISLPFYFYNVNSGLTDTIQFTFNVLPDLYPKIDVKQHVDSMYNWQREFWIHISDDYGFSKLLFVLQNNGDTTFNIPIKLDLIEQEIYLPFDFSYFLQSNVGRDITYYFKICDNDPLLKGKCTKSQTFTFHIPTQKEIEQYNDQISSNLINALDKSYEKPYVQNDKINKLLNEMLSNKLNQWQQSEKFQQLIQEQKTFLQYVDKIVNDFSRLIEFNKLFSNSSYDDLKKVIQELKENDMQNLLNQIEKMLQDQKFDQAKNMLEQLKEENQNIKEMLEQLNHLYKQSYVEENLKNIKDKLENLSKNQEELSNQSLRDELQKQNEINQEYKNLLNKLDTIEKFNKELDFPFSLDSIRKDADRLKNELEQISNEIQKKSDRQINKLQKDASDKMQKLADDLEKAIQQQQKEQQMEDEKTLINLLKYLVKTSFAQEYIFKQLYSVSPSSPLYAELIKKQKILDDHLQTIHDSIKALGKRNPLIDQKIRKELRELNTRRKNVAKYFNERNTVLVSREQQYIMLHMNNLALMLAEALKQQQEQNQNNMNANMKIKSSCKRKGKGSQNKPNPNPQTIRQLQEELNKRIQQLKEQMQKGENGKNFNEELMKAAFQQEAIRKAMQEYLEQFKGQGERNTKGIQNVIDDMEKIENDLIHKKLNEETMQRLHDITVKLLESEKADLQKEIDPKRESRTAKEINNSNPFTKIEYKEIKKVINEQMKNIPIEFNQFYRQRINEYYQKVK